MKSGFPRGLKFYVCDLEVNFFLNRKMSINHERLNNYYFWKKISYWVYIIKFMWVQYISNIVRMVHVWSWIPQHSERENSLQLWFLFSNVCYLQKSVFLNSLYWFHYYINYKNIRNNHQNWSRERYLYYGNNKGSFTTLYWIFWRPLHIYVVHIYPRSIFVCSWRSI